MTFAARQTDGPAREASSPRRSAESPPSPVLRPMTEADLDAVSAIYVAHAREAPPSGWREGVRRLLSGGAGRGAALVASLPDGEVVGYAVAEVRSWEFGSPPAGWITGLGVAQAHQHRGIARALLSVLVAHLHAAGVTAVRSMAKRDDVAVLRLFRSSGFSAGPYVELEHSQEGT